MVPRTQVGKRVIGIIGSGINKKDVLDSNSQRKRRQQNRNEEWERRTVRVFEKCNNKRDQS
jgi:hypothetical protein